MTSYYTTDVGGIKVTPIDRSDYLSKCLCDFLQDKGPDRCVNDVLLRATQTRLYCLNSLNNRSEAENMERLRLAELNRVLFSWLITPVKEGG